MKVNIQGTSQGSRKSKQGSMHAVHISPNLVPVCASSYPYLVHTFKGVLLGISESES